MRHWFSDIRPFQRDPLGFIRERGEASNGKLERLHLGRRPVWLVTDPALVRDVLKASEDKIDKGRLIHKLRPIVGMSTLTISGAEHDRRRQALHATFARTGAAKYVPHMAAAVQSFATHLLKANSFNAHHASAMLTLRMICIVMFGRNVLTPGDEQALVEAVNLVEDDITNALFRVLPVTPWKAANTRRTRRFARHILDALVDRIKQRCTETSALNTLRSLGLSDNEIRDEVITMLIAGHHTTGSAAAWMLYYLSEYPDLAEDIAQEAAAITTDSGEIDTSRLARANVSLSLVKEVLRLYPSAHWFSREARADFELEGYQIRKGHTFILAPWLYHRSEKYWEEPDNFCIDRSFSGKAYLPFGAGPRACLGMGLALLEMQILALEICSGFTIHNRKPGPIGQPISSVTLVPPEIWLSVTPREQVRFRAAAE